MHYCTRVDGYVGVRLPMYMLYTRANIIALRIIDNIRKRRLCQSSYDESSSIRYAFMIFKALNMP